SRETQRIFAEPSEIPNLFEYIRGENKNAGTEFSTNRMQSQTCLNYAEVRQKMQELKLKLI
ncbi:MAG: hypothetical protein KBT06_02520, partial [Prevotellaceae bacterium]|nr:hypothetical protein [Candidatus Colivivens equi]